MAAQTISLKSAFTEAERLGIPIGAFKIQLAQTAQRRYVPATAGYWIKAGLSVTSGETLSDALRGTNLSGSAEGFQIKERSLRSLGKSHHWYHDQCHTIVFTGFQWLVYATNWLSEPATQFYISQSYWDMEVSIAECQGMILFESLKRNTRFEASLIDFDLRSMKAIWEGFGPSLTARLGRPPKYKSAQVLAEKWMQTNQNCETPDAFKSYVQSLFPDKLIPKETMRRVFIPDL